MRRQRNYLDNKLPKYVQDIVKRQLCAVHKCRAWLGVGGGRIIQVVAQSHDIEGEQRENRCQLSTSNATAVSFSIFFKQFFHNPNSFLNRKKMYLLLF